MLNSSTVHHTPARTIVDLELHTDQRTTEPAHENDAQPSFRAIVHEIDGAESMASR